MHVRTILAAAVCGAGLMASMARAADEASSALPNGKKPNIVYILCDDLGIGDVHVFNPTRGKIATPNFDKLAADGMQFTDAHSADSVCTPSRYGILTGRYA